MTLGAGVRRARHHHRVRDLHRQLAAGQCADQHGELPDRDQQRHPGRARRERRHGRWRHRGARGAGPVRSRSPVRTATTPRSTASPRAARPCRSGRTRASSARPPVRQPSPWRRRAQGRGDRRHHRLREPQRHDADLVVRRAGRAHPGQPPEGRRSRQDHAGGALRGRRGRQHRRLPVVPTHVQRRERTPRTTDRPWCGAFAYPASVRDPDR